MTALYLYSTKLLDLLTRGILIFLPLQPAMTVISSWQEVLHKGADV